MRYAIRLVVVMFTFVLIVGVAAPALSTTDAIAPTADSWVELTNPDTNKGSDQTLHARVNWDSKKGIVTNLRRSYLKFDLSGLPPYARIDRAILHIYRKNYPKEDFIPSVYSTADNWIESVITWNNQPGPGALENDSGTASGSWVEWDITSYAASEFDGDKVLSVVLRFNPESGLYQHTDFTSREGELNQRPWLEISYSIDTTPPPAPTLISPENGDNILDNTPTFVWTSVTDPSGVTYQIQVDDNSDFSSPVYSAIDLHDNFDNNEPALGMFVKYFWHVRAKDGVGNIGVWSEEWNFTVVPVGTIGVLLMPLLFLLPFLLILRRQNRRYPSNTSFSEAGKWINQKVGAR